MIQDAQMSIRQAVAADIPAIEGILLDAAEWMERSGQPMWPAERVRWRVLCELFAPRDFYILYIGGEPAGCIALVDYDPHIWPDIARGESLFVHKLAVRRAFAGQGYAKVLLDYAKDMARRRDIHAVRLDCHRGRPKLRALYEREGFVCAGEAVLFGRYETAFYAWTDA